MTPQETTARTIKDFGDQWVRYTANDGYYGSSKLFADIVEPLMDPSEVADKQVAEIGSGTGRIVRMLIAAGAARVMAVEPSRAIDVLRKNVAEYGERVVCLEVPGQGIPATAELDIVFSIGVLHHIPDPDPVVEAALRALKPGGRMLIWLYGKEGNGAYLALVTPLRALTAQLPHFLLAAVVWLIYWPMAMYMALCRFLPLPMRGYMRDVIGRMSPDKRRLIIYDQLNPAYAKYYTREEAVALLGRHGFKDVSAHHRHGYSWTVVGTKPNATGSGRND
jgi:SAM-dependent methyltransferase